MGNDKEIRIETKEKDVGLDDNIKAGARALGKKIEDSDRHWGRISSRKKERVVH